MARPLSLLAAVLAVSASPLGGERSLYARNATCDPSASPNPGTGVQHYEVGVAENYWPWQIYKSSPYNPPVMQINTTGNALAPGLIFVSIINNPLNSSVKQSASTIFTDDGQLVWSSEEGNTDNLAVWTLFDEQVIIYSNTTNPGDPKYEGRTYGEVKILDTSYSEVTTICPNFNLNLGLSAGNETLPCQADHHEAYITDRNTLLVPAFNVTPADLTSVGGPADGWLTNSLFYELDIETGEVLFSWNALDHIPLSDSHNDKLNGSHPFDPPDWFHINAIQSFGDYYLVNGRATWSAYYIDKNGDVMWRFYGGDGGDFDLVPSNATFNYQHDSRISNVGPDTFDISLFNNNEGLGTIYGPSNVMLFTIPHSAGLLTGGSLTNTTAVLDRQIQNDPALYTNSEGGYVPDLPGGYQIAAYGTIPMIKQYGPTHGSSNDSQELWSGRIGFDNNASIYRAFKQEWHATPWTAPSLVVEAANNGSNASESSDGTGYKGYVSWNGATDLTGWNVYVGTTEESLEMVGMVGYMGFETEFDVVCWAEYVQVGAVVNGTEGKKSKVVEVV